MKKVIAFTILFFFFVFPLTSVKAIIPPEKEPERIPSVKAAETENNEEVVEDDLNEGEGDESETEAESRDLFSPVDNSIISPKLSYIINQGLQMDMPITETVEAKISQRMKLVGTSDENAEVVIIIGSSIFETEADKYGYWETTIDTSSLSEETYTVRAQSQVDESRGSTVEEYFKLKMNPSPEVTPNTVVNQIMYPSLWEKLVVGPYRTYTIVGLLLFLVFLIALLFTIVWRKDKRQKSGKEERFNPKDLVKKYSLKEVLEHRDTDSAWIVIDKKVYDITEFIKLHPGKNAILEGLGKDSTKLFFERPMGSGTPHTKAAQVLLQRYYIGDLKDEDSIEEKPKVNKGKEKPS